MRLRPFRQLAIPLVALAMWVSASASASAAEPSGPDQQRQQDQQQKEKKLHWDESWPRFRTSEYVLTAVAGPTAIAMYWFLPDQSTPHWVGGILFDDDVRNALRLHSPQDLRTVRVLADAVDVTLVVTVVGIDSFALPLLRGSTDVAWQLTVMNAEAFSLSSILTFSLYDTVGRARPSYEDCQHDGTVDAQCTSSPTASFPSGHVNEAFTAAGLSCAHHAFVPLYGSRFWDGLACARDLTLATTDGVLRIMGDRHYLTDVLAGGAIGFTFGFGVPTLLHYTAGSRRPLTALSFAPMPAPRLGIVASGEF